MIIPVLTVNYSRLFNELSAGGLVMMPLAHQFWGAFFGIVTDQSGIQWMLSYVA